MREKVNTDRRQTKLYFSAPMGSIGNLRPLKDALEKLQRDAFEVYLPQLELDQEFQGTYHYVHSDLYFLEKADALIIHMDTPSIGASAEFGYFLAKHPHRPILGYRCMKHGWLEKFLTVNSASLSEIYILLCKIFCIEAKETVVKELRRSAFKT